MNSPYCLILSRVADHFPIPSLSKNGDCTPDEA
jgi:hypothetical protein